MQEVLVTILIVLVVFLICREILCWYWKVNKIVSLLEGIQSLLRAQGATLGVTPPVTPPIDPVSDNKCK